MAFITRLKNAIKAFFDSGLNKSNESVASSDSIPNCNNTTANNTIANEIAKEQSTQVQPTIQEQPIAVSQVSQVVNQTTQEHQEQQKKDLQTMLKEITLKGVALSELLTEDDFVIVGNNIDITKDGLLKLLNTIPKYDLTVELASGSASMLNDEKVIVKAIIKTEERKAEGFGMATLSEVLERRRLNPRAEHDALALAETRAVKRAIEWLLGTAVVNMAVKRLISQGSIKVEEETMKANITKVFDATPNPNFKGYGYYRYPKDTVRYVINNDVKNLNDITKEVKEVKPEPLEVKATIEENTEVSKTTQEVKTNQEVEQEVDMNTKEINEKIEKERQIDYASLYRRQLEEQFPDLYKDEEPDYSELDEPDEFEEEDDLEDEPIEIDEHDEPEDEVKNTQYSKPTMPSKPAIQQPKQPPTQPIQQPKQPQSTQPPKQPTQQYQQPTQTPKQPTQPPTQQPNYNKNNNYNYNNNYNKGYYNKGYNGYRGNGNGNGNGNGYYKLGEVSQEFLVREYTKRRRLDLKRIFDEYEIDNILMKATNWSQWVEVVKGRLEAILERELSENKPSELMRIITTEFPPFIEIEKV